MPTVLEWNPTVDPSEFARQVRETLAAGSLVVVPGDVGYAVLLSAASGSAAAHLEVLREVSDSPPSLLAFGHEDPTAFGFEVPPIAKRLMSRSWPAPLAVELTRTSDAGASSFGETIRFRCPDHRITEAIFPAIHANGQCMPIFLVDTFLPSAAAVLERLGDAVGIAVAAGELPTDQRPTAVRVTAEGWEIVEPGAFAADDVRRLTARIVLFVCTGNTCRSPLAEGLARKLLAEKLQCPAEELPARGIWLLSAGVAAYGGSPASPESADVAAEFGADIRDHRSRPVNPQLLAAADDVIAMTRGHAYALAAQFPGIGPAPRLLCGDEADLADPIGASLETYRDCAHTILRHLERFIPEWVGP